MIFRAPAVSLCVFSPLWDPRLGTSLFLSLSHAPAVSLCVCVFFSVRPTIWTQDPVSLSLSTWVQVPVSLYLFFSRVPDTSLCFLLCGAHDLVPGPRSQSISLPLSRSCRLSLCVFRLCGPHDLGPGPSLFLSLSLSLARPGAQVAINFIIFIE